MANDVDHAQLKEEAFEALRDAEVKMYRYFAACEVGEERIKASEVYENIRNAGRIGQKTPWNDPFGIYDADEEVEVEVEE